MQSITLIIESMRSYACFHTAQRRNRPIFFLVSRARQVGLLRTIVGTVAY
jgi:hypothetical protein